MLFISFHVCVWFMIKLDWNLLNYLQAKTKTTTLVIWDRHHRPREEAKAKGLPVEENIYSSSWLSEGVFNVLGLNWACGGSYRRYVRWLRSWLVQVATSVKKKVFQETFSEQEQTPQKFHKKQAQWIRWGGSMLQVDVTGWSRPDKAVIEKAGEYFSALASIPKGQRRRWIFLNQLCMSWGWCTKVCSCATCQSVPVKGGLAVIVLCLCCFNNPKKAPGRGEAQNGSPASNTIVEGLSLSLLKKNCQCFGSVAAWHKFSCAGQWPDGCL